MGALVTTSAGTAPGSSIMTAPARTVLSEQRSVRIPVSGKIRSGIKVLTKSAASNAAAVRIYADGVAQGLSFDAIAKQIEAACSIKGGGLTPKNVPYFTARRADFAMPEVADQLMEMHGEDRDEDGKEVRRLYRIPVIFPCDDWKVVLPHALKAHTASQLLYWSEYDDAGTRLCMTHGKAEIDERTKRARRLFGGRPVVPRAENEGRCDPDRCPEYQARKCTLAGSILFYVPGIPGGGAFEVSTNSFYSLSQCRQTLEMIEVLLGRISGVRPDGKPLFWLIKRQGEVSMLDPETGQAERVTQYLINLEADVQMDAIWQPQAAQIAAGRRAVAALAGPAAAGAAGGEPSDADEFDGTITGELLGDDEPAAPAAPAATSAPAALTPDQIAEIKDLRDQVADGVRLAEVSGEAFRAFAVEQWGDDWWRSPESLRAALDALDDPETLKTNMVPF